MLTCVTCHINFRASVVKKMKEIQKKYGIGLQLESFEW